MHVEKKTKLATSFFPEKEPDRINNKQIHRILLEVTTDVPWQKEALKKNALAQVPLQTF